MTGPLDGEIEGHIGGKGFLSVKGILEVTKSSPLPVFPYRGEKN